MPYCTLDPDQSKYLQKVVADKTVIDMGCGDGHLAQVMANTAHRVIAVDKQLPQTESSRGVEYLALPFSKLTDEILKQASVAVFSWPHNDAIQWRKDADLISRLSHAEVIYIGQNAGGTQCGTRDFWLPLTTREVWKYLKAYNELIHYGTDHEKRPLLREELYGLVDGWYTGLYNSPSPEGKKCSPTCKMYHNPPEGGFCSLAERKLTDSNAICVEPFHEISQQKEPCAL